MPTALYGVVLLMAAIAYYILQQTIIASQGRDSLLAAGRRQRLEGQALAGALPRRDPARVLSHRGIARRIYVLVALIWLVPDRRIEKALARREA